MRFDKKIHTHYIVVRIIKIEHSNQSPNQVNLHAVVYLNLTLHSFQAINTTMARLHSNTT